MVARVDVDKRKPRNVRGFGKLSTGVQRVDSRHHRSQSLSFSSPGHPEHTRRQSTTRMPTPARHNWGTAASGTLGRAAAMRLGSGEFRRHWLRRCAGPLAAQPAPSAAPLRSARIARLEAALLVSDRPLTARKLALFAMLADADDVLAGIDQLNQAYDSGHAPFRIERVATGFQLLTRPEFAPWLERLHERHSRLKLSPPAMETLAIVAYRQPLTRADVEAVRGVQSGEMLKQLMERGLVRIVGEHDSLGRPFLYGTTRQFLELFGLASPRDLPDVGGLLRQDALVEVAVDEAEFSESNDEAAAA